MAWFIDAVETLRFDHSTQRPPSHANFSTVLSLNTSGGGGQRATSAQRAGVAFIARGTTTSLVHTGIRTGCHARPEPKDPGPKSGGSEDERTATSKAGTSQPSFPSTRASAVRRPMPSPLRRRSGQGRSDILYQRALLRSDPRQGAVPPRMRISPLT